MKYSIEFKLERIRKYKNREYRRSVRSESQTFSQSSIQVVKIQFKDSFKYQQSKLFLSAILDMYNGSIISYNISIHSYFNQIKICGFF